MRLCRREGGSVSPMKGYLMHQRSCRSQSLQTCMITFLPGLERRNCRTRWKMRGESALVLSEQFALAGERTHCVMCDFSLQKSRRLGRPPAKLKRWALRSSKGFHGYWESKLTKKLTDLSVYKSAIPM